MSPGGGNRGPSNKSGDTVAAIAATGVLAETMARVVALAEAAVLTVATRGLVFVAVVP